MTLRLVLIRHAKSSWDDPMADDHARILNARGRDSADRLGRWLAAEGHRPDTALVSDAARTRETWARIAAGLPGAPAAQHLPALYHAGPDVMLRCLQAATGDCVAMVGHNPGIAGFARWLLAEAPAHPRFADYPTGATLVAEFPAARWADVAPGSGRLVAFVVPRELPEATSG